MDPLTIWLLALATLWLLRMLVEELVAAVRGRPSPRIARREARERLAAEHGRPTVGQAIEDRLAHRIANPPDRQWAVQLRTLLAELSADAVGEARVRHHINRQARARRHAQRAGWKVRTGGASAGPKSPPRQPPPDEPVKTRLCRECRTAHVVPPADTCRGCEQATAPPPPPASDPPADEPPPVPTEDDTAPPEREAPPMADTATHTINGDVRDPRTALAFATACRGMNDAVARELDILATNMQRVGVGPKPLAEVRVLGDAARTYSASSRKSVEAYAAHVVTQADLAGDEDLRNTVRRTYLDTRGGDAAPTPPNGGSTTRTIRASDCDTPAAGAKLMDAVATVYAALRTSVDQAKGKHEQQGVSDDPVKFLAEQLDMATTIATQAGKSAATFRRHAQKRNDTVGKDKSLGGTQTGKYLDPAKA